MEDVLKMKELINKLIEWLKSKDFSEKDIVECIDYITKQTVAVTTA